MLSWFPLINLKMIFGAFCFQNSFPSDSFPFFLKNQLPPNEVITNLFHVPTW